MKRRRQLPLKRRQFRVTIDEAMGEMWDWVESLKPGVAPREILAAARVGVAVFRGAYPDPFARLPSRNGTRVIDSVEANAPSESNDLAFAAESLSAFTAGGGSLAFFDGPPIEPA
jgi:hypothetical protein